MRECKDDGDYGEEGSERWPGRARPSRWRRRASVGGLIKSVIYGALVALAGCLRGIQCGRSAATVGQATTSAVVTTRYSVWRRPAAVGQAIRTCWPASNPGAAASGEQRATTSRPSASRTTREMEEPR
jgi:hypothetical protein